MKDPLLLVIGAVLYWTCPTTCAQKPSSGDTLTITFITPHTTQSAKELADSGSPQIPGAYLVVPNLSAIQQRTDQANPQYIAFDLPISPTRALNLVIHEITVVTQDFQISTSSGHTIHLPALRFYAGKVIGDTSSTVVLSSSDQGLEGLIYGKDYSYTLGKIKSTGLKNVHVVYQTQELPNPTEFGCKSVEVPVTREVIQAAGTTSRLSTDSDCRGVAIYLEADYQLYRDWGSDVPYIASKIITTFANVVILYANEDIEIGLSALKIWDTPDPYILAGTPNEILSKFKNYWNARGNTFNGDIAHLLSTHISQGGVAYYGLPRRNNFASLNDISAVFSDQASRSYAFSVSTGFHDSVLRSLPTFSYNVYLIAHELGHNFGLPHTHSCLWAGGPIDNCGNAEDGTCAPGPSSPNQGTIMSYCPNLANGFGPQPRAKMKYELLVAQNLMKTGTNPVQITPSVVTANQYQFTSLDVSNCSGRVLWSDGVFSESSRTLLPSEPTTYYVSCLTDGCLSAPATASVNVVCVKPASCSVSASNALSLLYGIASFSFNTLWTNNTNGTPASLGTSYEDFTCTQHTLVKAGDTYPFTLSGTFGNSVFGKIYIDFNGNGQFTENDEMVYLGLSLIQHTGTITIPSTALRGTPLRMRVMLNPLPILNACSLPSSFIFLSGKVNDYAITITDSSCLPTVRESVRSGRWDDPLVWSCGTLPSTLDRIIINEGHYITLPADFTGYAGNMDLRGVIQPDHNSTLRMIDP
jgi:hypothetical protein